MEKSYGQYLSTVKSIVEKIETDGIDNIELVAQKFAKCIGEDNLVHMYGSGHSRIGVEEMFPRYGSYPGYHPIVELSTTFYQQVTGPNGIRQSMFLENVEGLANRILDNFEIKKEDCFLLFTTSGTGNVVIDMAIEAKKRGCFVVVVSSLDNCEVAVSKHSTHQIVTDIADVVLDNCAPIGDACVKIDNLKYPVAPTSTIGNALLVNLIKSRVAELLTAMDKPPYVITHAHFVGKEESQQVFRDVLDDYDRRLKR
jgi:uncharacterized phosphosugar-binding protein